MYYEIEDYIILLIIVLFIFIVGFALGSLDSESCCFEHTSCCEVCK